MRGSLNSTLSCQETTMVRKMAIACWGILIGAASAQDQAPMSRAELQIPEALWREVLTHLQQPGPALGYPGDVMRNYRYDRHLLRSVETLFSDVRALPRYSGKVSDEVLAAADDPARLLWLGHTLIDISAGRDWKGPELRDAGEPLHWGVSWVEEGADATAALREALHRLQSPGQAELWIPQGWHELPNEVQRLVARLLVGIAEALPYIQLSNDAEAVLRAAEELGGGYAGIHRLATAPWTEEREWQFVTANAPSFRMLDEFDREYAAFASVVLARYAWAGIQEFAAWEGRLALPRLLAEAGTEALRFETGYGEVVILGAGDDTLDGEHPLLVVDLGGNDTYRGHVAASAGPQRPIGMLVDLGGDDIYDGSEAEGTFAAGVFGIGMLFDLAGNDRYHVKRSGLGAAHFGVGLLYDAGGDDEYIVDHSFAQGAGIAGLGMLVDLAGDDRYTCGSYSQGLGGTLGAGVLLDVAGNDRYTARDDGNISELYENQSVAMSQGCGWGRRADFGDGHSLAGGVGALIDGAGDDHYHAQVWAQGCGFWWGLGMLEDRGGNDVYRNGKYSAGAAAHFALGICVDLAGDDQHNLGNDTARNQYLGHARDGSLGVFIDGDGDDQYMLRDHCGGSGDLGSVALFWDRRGDDLYILNPSPKRPTQHGNDNTPPLGTSTWYPPMRTFRDDLSTFGIFLDTGGRDRYEGEDVRQGDARPQDGAVWKSFHPWGSWGVGMDAER
jgi:hypothetical protein